MVIKKKAHEKLNEQLIGDPDFCVGDLVKEKI